MQIYRRLKGQHKNSFEIHFPAKLICRKGLAKTHFCVPQEFRRSRGIVFYGTFVIFSSAHYGSCLFGTHFEIFGTDGIEYFAAFQFIYRCTNIIDGTEKPFIPVLTLIELSKTVSFQNIMYIVVGKAGAVGTHCGFCQKNFIGHRACMQLLSDTGIGITVGIADFYVTLVRLNAFKAVGISRRIDLRTLFEIFIVSHCCHRLNPLVLSLIL